MKGEGPIVKVHSQFYSLETVEEREHIDYSMEAPNNEDHQQITGADTQINSDHGRIESISTKHWADRIDTEEKEEGEIRDSGDVSVDTIDKGDMVTEVLNDISSSKGIQNGEVSIDGVMHAKSSQHEKLNVVIGVASNERLEASSVDDVLKSQSKDKDGGRIQVELIAADEENAVIKAQTSREDTSHNTSPVRSHSEEEPSEEVI
ncbi:hypothetical protein K7X08_035640 [Anisodus acutangulus]|uniref:Uncharacterized protein n=1 Tax=Anisodus acutangulus TaxID=402998 RepID=A0A9Q1R221_9SOLA|nr:hypothetical protein K7X08_035640 [Anisodus acutangulus]